MIFTVLPLLWAGPPDEAASQRAVQPTPPVPETGLKFFGLVQSRATASNEISTSIFSDGQVVGLLGGSNQTTVSPDETTLGTEFRADGFFGYTPRLLDGALTLNAAFEVDYGFGDQAYQTGGNTGGGFGGDQVNLQTRRLNVVFRPKLGKGHRLTGVVGLQFVADGVYDPAASRLDDLTYTGGGLRFFGSEAAGFTLYGAYRDDWGDRLRYRLGGYTLYEQGVSLKDDITLYMADAEYHPAYATRVGVHGWYLRDRSGGNGGLVGTGLTSSLSELQGGPLLDLRERKNDEAPVVDADIYWIGVDGGYNHRLDKGPFAVGASVVGNLGTLVVHAGKDVGVQGLSVDLNGRWHFAQGDGSIFRLEGLYSSADGTGRDAYTGVVTANSYGIVGAIWTTHGSYILFPDGRAINRQASMVYDISNQGNGLWAANATVGYDIVPSRFNLAVGAAHARDARMNPIGTELNLRLSGRPWTFFEVGGVGALATGTTLPTDPWLTYAYLEWLVL